jgi:hypothetical protein
MKCLLLIFACLKFHSACRAQMTGLPASSAFIGIGAYTSSHANIFSVSKNQAALIDIKKAAVGVIAFRPFLLKGLDAYSTSIALNSPLGKVAIIAAYSGEVLYNESQFGIATARKLGECIQVGIQFNYNSIRQQGYGKGSAPGVEIGILIKLSEKCRVGIHAKNPVAGKFEEYERLQSIYSSGFGYEFSEKFSLVFEIIKAENLEAAIVVGVIYCIDPRVMICTGVSTLYQSPWFSIEYLLKKYSLSLGTSYHQQLGFSPTLAIAFHLKSPVPDKKKVAANE